ncbi:unnamed protein product [Pneumocystis jirovecii]|uniref:aspartate transaminase n=2 Tax=Pneumocystis jirovecii TaxID=42068 RepID=L0PF21_PNEJI|nr:uncharacterized protein T551_01945 [Pneumocystis jirovecii RU7]KTW30001.1 hypothetical protein T551_01945 [Pneumocystis jirovecii RU7]CCJ30827.1 unnamed protein product [Pneumocystis jirovecii]
MQSLFKDVPFIERDVLFELKRLYKEDKSEKKVDLGIGAYRDDCGKPWVLSSVKIAESKLLADPNYNHEYLDIEGLPSFIEASKKLIFGEDSSLIHNGCVSSIQTVSGTGANHMGALFMSLFNKGTVCYLSKPTWINHKRIWTCVGVPIVEYPYFDNSTLGIDFENMISTIQQAPEKSIILLHVSAHNPTGVDPTYEQWIKICDVIQEKNLFPFFDFAYQGFVSGNVDEDAWPVRYFASKGLEFCVCQSFAKNFGLYGERCGCLHIVTKSPDVAKNISSQLSILQRSEISSPPSYGAKIVSLILNDEQLTQEWKNNLLEMSSRIKRMRMLLYDNLTRLGTPGSWEHIINQKGMFSYTGLNKKHIQRLMDEFHIYILYTGRISMSGLRSDNVEYVAKAINIVVSESQCI